MLTNVTAGGTFKIKKKFLYRRRINSSSSLPTPPQHNQVSYHTLYAAKAKAILIGLKRLSLVTRWQRLTVRAFTSGNV